jgi:hypothetical protein
MKTIKEAEARTQIRSGHFIMISLLMALGGPLVSGTAAASEIDRPMGCKATETTELNRWPLRAQDGAGCPAKGQGQALHQTTRSAREVEAPALNRWPYVFSPKEIESDESLVVENAKDHPKTSGRTEPDLNMWPLWPKS